MNNKVPRQLLEQTLECVALNGVLPVSFSATLKPFIEQLAEFYSEREDPISLLISNAGIRALENEILAQLVPDNLKPSIDSLVEKCKALHLKMDDEVFCTNFEAAANYRHMKIEHLNEINKLLGDQLLLTPEVLIASLRGIGFNETLPATQTDIAG